MRAPGALAALAFLVASCGEADNPTGTSSPPPPSTTIPAVAPPPVAATLLAAGDIASCSSDGDEATAALLDSLVAAHPDAVVAALGDLAYDSGTAEEFSLCYDPSWGRHRARTRPALGNHDAATPGAAGYRSYFGGVPRWYSYQLGAWHVVVLDSNCAMVGCEAGGEQERWLREDLRQHPARCTLAYWHHAPFSSGTVHGSDEAVAPLFRALADAGADVVLAGHEHNYERFAPIDGVRPFVVGTGGRSLYPFGRPLPGSEVRDASTFGVLALTLRPDGYDWEFLPIPSRAAGAFTDRGSDSCRV